MNILGVHLTLLIGPTIPKPANPLLMESLQRIEVQNTDDGRSGFRIDFEIGRTGPFDLIDYPIMNLPAIRLNSRVIVVVRFNLKPYVLIDGLITNQQITPSNSPGGSTFTVLGEDVSIKMDNAEHSQAFAGRSAAMRVQEILTSYLQYFPIQIVDQTRGSTPPPPGQIPAQRGTDLQYVRGLAQRYGNVFYIKPGTVPMQNTAYWGPRGRIGPHQTGLSVNLGPRTNVEAINIMQDIGTTARISGWIQDRDTNIQMPLQTVASTRPPLSLQPTLAESILAERARQPNGTEGLSYAEALQLAQALTDESTDESVVATGEIDSLRYGAVLRAHELVDVRGVGRSFDGTYLVTKVRHSISKGSYRQSFTLARDGLGTIVPAVIPGD